MNKNLLKVYDDILKCKSNLNKDNLDKIINNAVVINSFLLDEFRNYFIKEDIDYIINSTNQGLSINSKKGYEVNYSKNIIFTNNEEFNLIQPKELASIFSSETYNDDDKFFWEILFYDSDRFIGLNIFLINS